MSYELVFTNLKDKQTAESYAKTLENDGWDTSQFEIREIK